MPAAVLPSLLAALCAVSGQGERVASLTHTMAIEAQAPDDTFQSQQIAATKDELLRGRRSRLWD